MHDESFSGCGQDRIGEAAVTGALRALPTIEPVVDLWPVIAQRLREQNGNVRHWRLRRRRSWALAAAAMVALAVLAWWPVPIAEPERHQIADVEQASMDRMTIAVGDDARLIARSQWLERVIDSPALMPVVQDGDQALLELGLREQIGQIDAALAEQPGSPELWRARVMTLGDLAELRWAGRRTGLVSATEDDARLQWIQ